MIDPKKFADKQLELAAEFAQYLADHPEADELLPEKAHVFFEIEGDTEFNTYSRELAQRRQRAGDAIICVRTKGLAPPPVSRLIDPQIQPVVKVG